MNDYLQRRVACAAFLSALAACVGGGGGGGGSAPTPPPPPPSGPAALAMPAAGALGTVLAASAYDLRPMGGGTQWNFHAKQYASDSSTATLYDSTISQAGNDDGSVTETDFQVFQGDGGESLSARSGQIIDRFTLDLGGPSNPAVTSVELRSPVQVNDQYVQWQSTNLDVGDIDGDGKDDFADILLYAKVVGTDQVALPELHRSVSAVRVDSTMLLRVTLSTTGQTAPIQNSVQSTWYASGIGVVRQTASAASTSGTGPIQYDEVLYAWNGGSAGLGAVGPAAIELPQDMWCCSGAEYLPSPLAATAIGNEALLVGASNSASTPSNLTASVFTSNGQLARAAEIPNMTAFAGITAYSTMVDALYATGTSTALLVAVGRDSGSGVQITLQAMDDTPAAVGAPKTIDLPAGYINAATAWDGTALWVMWEQAVNLSGSQLLLQPFDANGNALAAPQTLDTIANGSMGALNLAGANGKLLATWATQSFGGTVYRYASVAGSGGSAQVFTLGSAAQGYTGSIGTIDAPVPVLGDGVAALLWRGPLFSYASYGPLPEEKPRGVLLDASGQPLRSAAGATGTLDDELLPDTWAAQPNHAMVASALGSRLVVAGYTFEQTLSFTPSLVDVLHTSFLSAGTTPLATAAASATTFDAAGNDWAQSLLSETPSQILLWPDRALVVGTFPQGTALTQVWLN